MPSTKLREIYPARMVADQLVGLPGIFASTGANPADGISTGWLRSLADDAERYVKQQGGTQQEVDSIRWFGAENLRANYNDVLTPAEQMRDELAERNQTLAELRAIFEPITESKDPGLARIRELLGLRPV